MHSSSPLWGWGGYHGGVGGRGTGPYIYIYILCLMFKKCGLVIFLRKEIKN